MLEFLILCLLCILLFNYFLNGQEIVAPAVIFTGSFIVACVWAIFYESKWSLSLHANTFFVILGGVLTFTVISAIVKAFFSLKGIPNDSQEVASEINIVWWKSVIVCLLIGVSIWYTIDTISKIEPAATLSDSIFLYRTQSMDPLFNLSYIALPRGLMLLRTFSESAGYFFSYMFAKNLIESRKTSWLYLLVIILSIIDSLLLGSRTAAFRIVVCILICLYCIYKRKTNWSSTGNIKSLGIVLLVMIMVVVIFQFLATLLGRDTTDFSGLDYLAMYVGAEIKNLDIFLQSGNFPAGQAWGGQTFISAHNFISSHLGIGEIVNFDLPYVYVNGYSLGNVYTTFYAYIHDFGYVGVPILTGVIAFVSQVSFEFIKLGISKEKASLSMLIYSRILVTLVLSFFSNKFYEELFSIDFVEVVFVWLLLNWVLIKKSGFSVNKEGTLLKGAKELR